MSTTGTAKHPQDMIFRDSAARFLPIDIDGTIGIPLGIEPTCRGSLMTNEYDLVVELLIEGRPHGEAEIPIIVYRDVEGIVMCPTFSPNLRGIAETDLEDKSQSTSMMQLSLV